MNSNPANTRGRVFYIMLGIILVVVSALLVLKPVLRIIYPLKFEQHISDSSKEYGLDEHLVMAIISAESKFDDSAVSSKGAKGLMQLKDETALWCMENFGIEPSGDKNKDNIATGCAYMSYLTDKFGGCTDTALAAYNAGEGNVSKWLEEAGEESTIASCPIPFPETENYIKTVNNRYKIYKFLY